MRRRGSVRAFRPVCTSGRRRQFPGVEPPLSRFFGFRRVELQKGGVVVLGRGDRACREWVRPPREPHAIQAHAIMQSAGLQHERRSARCATAGGLADCLGGFAADHEGVGASSSLFVGVGRGIGRNLSRKFENSKIRVKMRRFDGFGKKVV